MSEKKRLNLAFSMDYPPHKEAWQALCSIPFGQRTDEVCRLLCQQREWEDLLTAIRSIVREEVQGLSFQPPPILSCRSRPGTKQWMPMFSAFCFRCRRKERILPDSIF